MKGHILFIKKSINTKGEITYENNHLLETDRRKF